MKTQTTQTTEREEIHEMVSDFVTDMTAQCKLLESIHEEVKRINSTLTESELINMTDNEVSTLAIANLGIAEALEEAGL